MGIYYLGSVLSYEKNKGLGKWYIIAKQNKTNMQY